MFFLLNQLFPLKVNIEYSQIITSSKGKVLHAFLTSDEKWRMKTELNEIIPELKKAIIYKEDKYFYYHFGINPVSIIRALYNNTLQNKKTSGASTITMQVARLLEPKERTYVNKSIETFRAIQLEFYYSKDEILQLYLNLVPYGGNIEAVKSASLLYFQRNPDHLSLAQIVTLTIIPNRPNSLTPGQNNDLIEKERNRWLKKFKADHIFPENMIEDALNEPLKAQRHQAPKFAPHFSYRLKSKYPGKAIIKTHLDGNIQNKVELITYNYIQRLKHFNIHNAAVIVIKNKSVVDGHVERQRNPDSVGARPVVIAYLGNADFSDTENAGQVDGIKAVRSPGSTLKPFVYALAIDKGIVTPKNTITDVPVNFGGYSPENFDKKFHGKVTIEQALAYSLNVPAVKLLDEVGVPAFIDIFNKAGFTQISRDENKLGLSVILGGCGVTLEKLATLYAAMANDGKYCELKWVKARSLQNKKSQLISSASTYMITEILTKLTRPDLPNNYQSSYHVPKIAWKTGTSYGRRDAWSIGFNKNYTIGVWVGNFSGEGSYELTGARIATPLLFEIFNTIEYNSQADWFLPPQEIKFRLVCEESGFVPNTFCKNQIVDYFIPTISSNKKCEHLKQVWVSAKETFSYCTSCLPEYGYKKKLYPNLPPELITWYEAENIAYSKIPEHNINCTRVFKQHAPAITSPIDGKEYIVDNQTELMLTCQADNEVNKVYWYINDKYYKAAHAGDKVFFIPESGAIKISCSDDKGRNSDIWIRVFRQ
ncbi:MAG: penicillin-binding protein 1C [Cytophagales bacterium]|nr:penicillin-binding protein 1C [Cytophagales bacterium]